MKCLVWSFHAHWLPALSLFHIRRSTRKPKTVFLGVTPGLKAFPSSLIDNNALARTFLPGRADTTPAPPMPALTVKRELTGVWRRHWPLRSRRFARSWQCWPMAWRLWQTAVVAQCQFLTILCDSRRALSIFFDCADVSLRSSSRATSLSEIF